MKQMVIVKLSGGMGNQMFQYALGFSLAKSKEFELKLDLRDLLSRAQPLGITYRDFQLDIFGINPNQASRYDLCRYALAFNSQRIRSKIAKIVAKVSNRIYIEKNFRFDKNVLNIRTGVYLDGYWQSEKYFFNVKELIKKEFTLRISHSDQVHSLAKDIAKQNSVCIFVRRTDFVNNPMHETTNVDYFIKAHARLIELTECHLNLYIFTDDIEWCEINLHLSKNQIIVGQEYYGPKYGSKFYLMTQCKHFIIPNSTYAWWAAWLSTSQDKIVIGPEKWFGDPSVDTSDIWPSDWIKV